jgi:hypothetical protein
MLCHECSKTNTGDLKLIPVEIRNDGLYNLTCPQGHSSTTFLLNPKFEILFEMAAMTLLDGHYKEAVSSMSSSLERFYEFYINVILFKNGIKLEVFEKAWKLVDNQSERQLGAFLFIHLLENKTIEAIDQKFIEFRNKVIHKGYIPSHDEVIQYGEHLYQFIVRILTKLKNTSEDAFWNAINRELDKMRKNMKIELITSALTEDTIINHAGHVHLNGAVGYKTFNEALSNLKSHKYKYR